MERPTLNGNSSAAMAPHESGVPLFTPICVFTNVCSNEITSPLNDSQPITFRVRIIGVLGFVACASLALFLNGCKVGPTYEPPEIETPATWGQGSDTNFAIATPELINWWTNFNDPILNGLIVQAASSNLNLRIAATRIEEARALRGIAKSGLAPQVDGVGSAQVQRFTAQTAPITSSPEIGGSGSIGASATWELDVWGRVRRAIESATAGFEASIEDYRDTMVILYAEVAATYIEVRTVQERIRYAETNAIAQAATVELTVNLNKAGLAGDLDVHQANLNLARTQSTIPTFRADLTRAMNRLGVLLGQTPVALHPQLREQKPIPLPPDVVQTGMPVDLLRHRPDIRRAERLLAAQTALIGVATAELYPRFFLPGTLTLDALDVGNISGSSVAYSFGPTMQWSLFTGGRIRNSIKVEEARTEEAMTAYDQTVLLALEDVENAMVTFAQERDRQISVTLARESARMSVKLVLDLYKSGLTQFQNVLDMERSLALEEDNLAVSRGLLAGNAVRIYQSLGGGWAPDEDNPTQTQSIALSASTESN